MSPGPALEVSIRTVRGSFRLEAELSLAGGTLAVIGPSGSGKTTLLAALCGLLRPESGLVRVLGETLFDSSRGIDVPPRKRRIGLVSQGDDLFPHLTVASNIALSRRWGRGRDKATALDERALVEALDLAPLLSRKVTELSGGEARRVALARTLLNGPRLVLLDEPFAGLDEPLRLEVLGAVLEARARTGLPMVLVTHRPAEAIALADHAVALSAGAIVAQGTALEVLTRPSVLPHRHLAGIETLFSVTPGPAGEASWGTHAVHEMKDGEPDDVAGPGIGRHWFALGADEVVLAREVPIATSARHAWPGVVAELHPAGEAVLVAVEIPGVPRTLLARVSREAVHELALRPGERVVALFKAASLKRLRGLNP